MCLLTSNVEGGYNFTSPVAINKGYTVCPFEIVSPPNYSSYAGGHGHDHAVRLCINPGRNLMSHKITARLMHACIFLSGALPGAFTGNPARVPDKKDNNVPMQECRDRWSK